jgi:hypothetical protein
MSQLAASSVPGLKVSTKVKAGSAGFNHNESGVTVPGLKVSTKVKAGGISWANHNETAVTAPGLKVSTKVKAGTLGNHNETLV